MNEDIDDLRERLAGLVEGAVPTSRVDVELAARTGRARLRRRRLGVVGTTVAMVLAVSAVVSLRPGGGPAPLPAGPAGPSASPSAPSPTGRHPVPLGTGAAASGSQAPHNGHDALSPEADFGWLPDDANGERYQQAQYGADVRADVYGKTGFTPIYRLKVYPPGVVPEVSQTSLAQQGVKSPAPDVNGSEAYWVTNGQGTDDVILRWRGPDGRWLEVTCQYLAKADREQVPLRIARDVHLGKRSVPLPAKLAGMPAAFTVTGVSFERMTVQGKSWWTYEIGYSAGPDQYFGITVTPDGEAPVLHPAPPGLEGTPPPLSSSDTATCRTDKGAKVCVRVFQSPAMLDPAGGPAGVLERVTLLGTDPSQWTTDFPG
ncbi:hypothetical protein [Kitasatospora cinereorecta]|uniref:LigA protein n=1 Tax=Kitasatospora cinereorecta TaxID=285560 RepID=A0ABW0VM77_9ACTN